jgi:hypothetical protein
MQTFGWPSGVVLTMTQTINRWKAQTADRTHYYTKLRADEHIRAIRESTSAEEVLRLLLRAQRWATAEDGEDPAGYVDASAGAGAVHGSPCIGCRGFEEKDVSPIKEALRWLEEHDAPMDIGERIRAIYRRLL